jgi:type IX secretion system PorP/SprF family membrane protein
LDELVREITENISDHKALVFSQFLGMLALIRERLEELGVKYQYFDGSTSKKANVYVGYSASHLTRPKDKFNGNGPNAKLPMRHIVHGGLKIRVNNLLSLTPNVLYMRQGTAQEKTIGCYSQYRIASETDLMAGANYRFSDALSPFLGFSHKRFVLGLSYDINTSELSKLAKGSNSFEISLSISGKKNLKTPEVEFVCPRL